MCICCKHVGEFFVQSSGQGVVTLLYSDGGHVTVNDAKKVFVDVSFY